MLTTTKAMHGFLRAEGESEDRPGTFEFRDLESGQKRIGQPACEAVMSWSDEVAQTQDMKPLVSRRITAIKSPWAIREKDGYPRFPSSEIVAQFVSMS